MTLLFFWLLLTTPADRHICSMWTSKPPTVETMRTACPWPLPDVDRLVMRAIDLYNGHNVCTRPAAELPTLNCDLYPLDAYRLEIVEPDFSQWTCTVTVPHEGYPTDDEIAADCGWEVVTGLRSSTYILKYDSSRLTPDDVEVAICQMPALPSGTGFLDMPPAASDLATDKPYALLAGRLIWYGLVQPDCSSWSGLDPVTLGANPCGEYAAQVQVRTWQNRYDLSIWSAGYATSVPPKLLKAVIAQESQFWPLWPKTLRRDETGLIQLTEDGADIVLRYSPELFAQACTVSMETARCTGYAMLPAADQERVRAVLRNGLDGRGSPFEAAKQAGSVMLVYAQILKAFYCYAQEIKPASVLPWDAALIAFHAGGKCLQSMCQAGTEYLDNVRR
jgi:hypothetical protein